MGSVPADVKYVMEQMGIKTWEAFKDLMKGPLRTQLSEGLESYRSGDKGDASKLSVESNASGRVRSVNETFAGSGVPASRTQPEGAEIESTFATRRDPFGKQQVDPSAPTGQLQRGANPTNVSEIASREKQNPTYTKFTAIRGDSGNLLTTETLSKLNNDDLVERYKVFFGEDPKDFETAKTELEDLLKNTNKTANPILD